MVGQESTTKHRPGQVSSMTGFARAAGSGGGWRWTFELKTVNAKGLDIRLRMPAPFDQAEGEARARLAKALARGTCFANLSGRREAAASAARIDGAALESIAVAARAAAAKAGLAPPTMDGMLALRGVVDVADIEDDEAAVNAASAGALASLDEAIAALIGTRRIEGAALAALLTERLNAIAALVEAADANPARRPEAVRDRLAQSVEALMGSSRGFDESRLHQEAILLAAKADIREELDRLKTHVAASRALIDEGGPIGRRLDFFSQELAREASTLCAKANAVSLTAQGLELRAQIEQFREQVQNVE
ncbi:MAG TPA: YicC/YloC family endoribonuclease [Roseiarcus sp.]|nr:YicC/YloC family endoribonuclease [Roseiarcus sp.]